MPEKGTFGDQDPFDEVEGGKEAILNKLVDVNDDVKSMPAGNNPYSAVKFGTLVGQSTLTQAETAVVDVYIKLAKQEQHVNYVTGKAAAKDKHGATPGSARRLKPEAERVLVATYGMSAVEQVALRIALLTGKVPCKAELDSAEFSYDEDPRNSASFKIVLKYKKKWMQDFLDKDDAPGLYRWLKNAARILANHEYQHASSTLTAMTDDLHELTVAQGYDQGFLAYFTEWLEFHLMDPIRRLDPLDQVILRRKVTGVRAPQGSAIDFGRYQSDIARMAAQIDALSTEVKVLRKGRGGPGKPEGHHPVEKCYECGEPGHYGKDCPVRKAKVEKVLRDQHAEAEAVTKAIIASKKDT